MNNHTKKFFIYTRKSTDTEDRQVRSISDQLAELKELIHREDPTAFIAIENLHEVANGNQGGKGISRKQRVDAMLARIFSQKTA